MSSTSSPVIQLSNQRPTEENTLREGLTSTSPAMDYLGEDEYPPPPQPQSQFVQTAAPIASLSAYTTDPYNGMPPPPTGEYSDLQQLMHACQDHARRHGYACVTASNNYKRGIAYVRCDRGGDYVNHWKLTDETRVRKNRKKRLVGCKWKARAKRNATGGWVLTIMEDKHNGHDPSGDATNHPSLRQLPAEAVEEAREAFKAKRSPKQVLELLQQQYNPAVTAQDVYNLKAKINRIDNSTTTTSALTSRTEADIPTDPSLQMQSSYQPFTISEYTPN
ncbi:MAG: hypothetical protein ALECFALPRED_004691 [Alectoria fallacina]|uniref:FAR1 domain-containing protein n=1 Tax=Alectoria fallacina TaxID=1903189 RepID=A0A8H3EK25_9LECA|nr:MAG: hypothetical protein ALECFALPRED_004691 [Alectoria fallacina]